MKELDSFTVEQLNNFIESDHAQCGDVAALARIALAAKRAEPDYHIVRLEHSDAWGKEMVLNTYEINLDAVKSKTDHGGEIIPVYTVPQLNSPEIPQGWIQCSDQMPDKEGHYTGWGTYYDGGEPCYIPFYYHCDNKKYKRDRLEPIEDDCDPDKVTVTHWTRLPAAPEKENG